MLTNTGLAFITWLLFLSILGAHCYEDVSEEDEAHARYVECQSLCDRSKGQTEEYTCRRRCKEQYDAYKEEIEKRRSRGGSAPRQESTELGRCWKECEERTEGIQTKFCKKQCESDYGSEHGGGRKF